VAGRAPPAREEQTADRERRAVGSQENRTEQSWGDTSKERTAQTRQEDETLEVRWVGAQARPPDPQMMGSASLVTTQGLARRPSPVPRWPRGGGSLV
jgi:hypothetical protein